MVKKITFRHGEFNVVRVLLDKLAAWFNFVAHQHTLARIRDNKFVASSTATSPASPPNSSPPRKNTMNKMNSSVTATPPPPPRTTGASCPPKSFLTQHSAAINHPNSLRRAGNRSPPRGGAGSRSGRPRWESTPRRCVHRLATSTRPSPESANDPRVPGSAGHQRRPAPRRTFTSVPPFVSRVAFSEGLRFPRRSPTPLACSILARRPEATRSLSGSITQQMAANKRYNRPTRIKPMLQLPTHLWRKNALRPILRA